jgi:hypothetical protein
MSEETDAVLVVVSEETGRISVAIGGVLEAVSRENLSRRLVSLLSVKTQGSVRNQALGLVDQAEGEGLRQARSA